MLTNKSPTILLNFTEWNGKIIFYWVLDVHFVSINKIVMKIQNKRFHDEEHANLLNSMWLTAITFLCVGYGDIVPNTYCGRGITLTCGMVVSNYVQKTVNPGQK